MLIKKVTFIFIAIATFILVGCEKSDNVKQVGIIVPIEHQALNDIVAGFTETLNRSYPGKIKYKIANAQGDLNLMRAITQQMRDQHMDLIVPVATSPMEMAGNMISKTPIVGLAAVYSENESQRKKCNTVIVHDEVPVQQHLQFIHKIYPNITHIALIHSPDDKIYAQVKEMIEYGKTLNITVKPYMINNLSELYSTSQNIPANTQALLILKDNLMASGVGTLTKVAANHHIPLITADEGTVKNGAYFALGIPERDIGVQGAKLALQILQEKKRPCELNVAKMTKLTVFLNEKSLANSPEIISALKELAKKNNYALEVIHG